MPNTLYIVEVDDRCTQQLVGHTGCSYASPPQPATQALALVRVLLGCAANALEADQSPWRRAIAGGTRTVSLHVATPTGQLTL
jgi:hypothetical protein